MTHVDYFKNHEEFVEYKAGDIILRQGEENNKLMYAVKAGEVEIVYHGEVLETIHPGEFFGEMSLVDSSPRSADAIAKTDCKIVEVDKYHFLYLVHESPTFALNVMHHMAERIRTLHGRLIS